MTENNNTNNEPETVEQMGWAELDKLAEEAGEILGIHDSLTNKHLVQRMITAVRSRNIRVLRELAYASEVFPCRENICEALKLLVSVH